MFTSKSGVERGIVRTFWDDGILDVLSGAVVLLIGVAWQFDLVPLGAIAPVVAVPFWKPLRAWITEPRLGHVEFSDAQTARFQSFLVWSFLLGCLTFVLGIAVYFYAGSFGHALPLQGWVAAVPAWAFAILALLTSMVILVRRFIAYASVFLLLGVLVVVLEQQPEVAMLVGGMIVWLFGLLRLLNFVHSHPRQPMEMNGA